MHATARTQAPPRSWGKIWNGPYVLRNWMYFWTALFLFAWFTPYTFGLFLCGGIALYSLRSPRHSVEALGMLAFLIVAGKTGVSLGRWLVLFAAFGRMLWDGAFGGRSMPRLAYLLLLFFAVVLPLSIFASTFPLVSGLKLITFTLGTVVTVVGFYRTRHLTDYWLSWLFTLGVFILLASLPFYGLPAGYATNSVGFQGILTHPQTFGPVLAPITALVAGLYFFRQRTSWIILLCVGLGVVGMYFSLSRTSLLAFALAGAITAALGFSFKPDTWAVDLGRTLGRPTVMLGALAALALVAVQWTSVQSDLASFLAKDSGTASPVQALEASRGNLMSQSMRNFRDHPLTGIGFGAPSDPVRFARQLERGPYGIPLSASVEKGFMPTAVLEETGIIGAILILLLLLFMFAPTVLHPDPTLFWVMATCLFLNFGEMVFFSVGGMGFFLWFVMAFCHIAALKSPAPSQKGMAHRKPAHTGRGRQQV